MLDALFWFYTLLGLVCSFFFITAIRSQGRVTGREYIIIICMITYLWPVVLLLLATTAGQESNDKEGSHG